MGYWELPEGTGCVEKTWITTKLATAIGLVGSAYHLVAFQPDSALAALQRATNASVTMASLGAIFGMATCLSAQAREAPEDPLNYFIGGCASGIFLGARIIGDGVKYLIRPFVSSPQCRHRYHGLPGTGHAGLLH
uniref:NADH dehydrogenase [ubiquinone] 1 alpha subcomplex subunit 11 n=1 Tax=Gasterosteus aculeatus aculeatus TaxID=481459 RepID=G3NBS3_GASAC